MSGTGPQRSIFLAMLGLWLVFPLILFGAGAQDGVTLLVGGDLVGPHPAEVYQGDEPAAQGSDVYVESFCSIHPPIDSCQQVLLVFSSPPQALPVLALTQLLPPDLAILALRIMAAAALVAGMLLLWNRVTSTNTDAATGLVVTAILLTPFAGNVIAIGQNTPLLFLLACIGLSRTDRTARLVAVAVLWPLAVAFKAFPLALGLIALWQRRWRVLMLSAAVFIGLTLAALAIGGTVIFDGYSDQLSSNSQERILSDVNASATAMLRTLFGSSDGSLPILLVAVPVLLLVPLTWLTLRMRDADTQWAFYGLVTLVAFPLVTSHYLWLGVAAVGVALGERQRSTRQLWLLPALAGGMCVLSVVSSSMGPQSWLAFLLMIASGAIAASVSERGSLQRGHEQAHRTVS